MSVAIHMGTYKQRLDQLGSRGCNSRRMVREMNIAGFEGGGRKPGAKEHRQTLEARKGKEMNFSYTSCKEMQSY